MLANPTGLVITLFTSTRKSTELLRDASPSNVCVHTAAPPGRVVFVRVRRYRREAVGSANEYSPSASVAAVPTVESSPFPHVRSTPQLIRVTVTPLKPASA